MYGQLRGAEFLRSKLTDCLLRSANLSDSVFDKCTLTSCDFSKAKFDGARFEETEMIRMDFWGWDGFPGATMPDRQRYRYFLGRGVRSKLDGLPIPSNRIAAFAAELDRTGVGDNEAMFIYDEWSDFVSFEDFIVVGKAATQTKG